MPTLKEPKTGTFDAADLEVLDAAVSDAWAVLSNPKHSRPWAYTREEVARHVINEAAKGQRDQATLTRHAIAQLLKV